ncbi:hypothetical protein K443DRAFT_355832 [Laccaria amethystina LaAM-08-1]|uniref:Uncharacterized protein n=1 Tax=Laccaria amethystina LaAM-08-1 TaxID=1095629 RepID=A0A0C9XEK9_9AGAR|nr:hypothetical protein K443DRAFT_355832 [Laccaria amethystina LaAM-08-1]
MRRLALHFDVPEQYDKLRIVRPCSERRIRSLPQISAPSKSWGIFRTTCQWSPPAYFSTTPLLDFDWHMTSLAQLHISSFMPPPCPNRTPHQLYSTQTFFLSCSLEP